MEAWLPCGVDTPLLLGALALVCVRLMHYWDYGTMRVACRVIKAHIPKGYLLSDH